jgi:thioredoxin-related protein
MHHKSHPSIRPQKTGAAHQRTLLSAWGPWLLIAGLVGAYAFTARTAPVFETWGTDVPSALAEAKNRDCKVLIAFSMPGCAPCVIMERRILSTSRIAKRLEGFVPLYIDVTKQPEVAERFGAFGTPTYAIVDPQGKLLNRSVGYQPVEQFEQFLSAVDR